MLECIDGGDADFIINHINLKIFMYADDVIVMATTKRSLQNRLDVLDKFGAEHGSTYIGDISHFILR